LLIISAAASSPAGQSSQSGTRLTGAAGDEPEDVPVTAAGARVGALIVVALGLNGTAAGAARAAGGPDVARLDPVELGAADEVVVADVVPVAEVVLVLPVLAAPLRLVLLPLVAAGAVTCAAAGAASTKLSSKARRGGSIMTVTRALPEPNATGAARFRGVDIDGSGATRRFHRRASAIPDARAA
jgi:hypothetical protein